MSEKTEKNVPDDVRLYQVGMTLSHAARKFVVHPDQETERTLVEWCLEFIQEAKKP